MTAEERSLTIRRTAAAADDNMALVVHQAQRGGLVGKQAVHQLMALPHQEARLALHQGGVLQNPLALTVVVEKSLGTMDGSGDSSLLACLEPDEIGQISRISPEIFVNDLLYLEDGECRLLDQEEVQTIFANDDAATMRRLRFFGPSTMLPNSAQAKRHGPWELLPEATVRAEAVLHYLQSVQMADRPQEWKKAAAEALSMDLLTYAACKIDGVRTACEEIDRELADQLPTSVDLELLEANLLDQHQTAIESFKVAPLTEEDIAVIEQARDASVDDLAGGLLQTEEFGELDREAAAEIVDVDTAIAGALEAGVPDDDEE